jgi:hypothetical protein
MPRSQSFIHKVFIGLLVFSLLAVFAAACGSDVDETTSEEDTTYSEENTAPEPDVTVAAEDSEQEPPADANQADSAVGAEADSGFRPETDGFSFENYGDESGAINLTAAEMQRMFGDAVCANTANGECTLTPPAQEWMDQVNQEMSGGHCEGMAVLSNLMYYNQVPPANFGGDTAHDLDFNNQTLQREIAYWWVTQATTPGGETKINSSPSAVLDTLMETFQQGKDASEWWALGIYKRDGSGGHAITPLAVDDQGNGIYNILVYDNNFPNEVRQIVVDRNAETWSYQASTNPNEPEELYEGDASTQTLEVVAISPRLQQQECTFCDTSSTGQWRGRGVAAPAQKQFYEIWLNGDTDLLIVDDQDRRLGYVNGNLVNEIPGASADRFRFGKDVWASDYEPIYYVPVGIDFEIVVDASRLEKAGSSDVSIVGPGYFVSIEEIWLEPGESDSIGITLDENYHQLTYYTDYAESPVIMMGIETPAADYAFLVQATELSGGEDTFDVGLDLNTGEFVLNTSFNKADSTYDFYVLRIDDQGEYAFGTDDYVLGPDESIYLQYTQWLENGGSMLAELDHDNDGQIDEQVELPDQSDAFDWGE